MLSDFNNSFTDAFVENL